MEAPEIRGENLPRRMEWEGVMAGASTARPALQDDAALYLLELSRRRQNDTGSARAVGAVAD